MSSGHVVGQTTNSLQKTECNNVVKAQSYPPLIFGRHLKHLRHLESDKKKLLWNKPVKIQA
jgi:hypothetical protein